MRTTATGADVRTGWVAETDRDKSRMVIDAHPGAAYSRKHDRAGHQQHSSSMIGNLSRQQPDVIDIRAAA